MNAARREQVCFRCGRGVIWVQRSGGAGPVAVEKCAEGTGDVAFQASLLAGGEIAVVNPGLKSGWRLHNPHCSSGAAASKPGSFTAMARQKVR